MSLREVLFDMSLQEVLFEKSMERLVATLMRVSSALGMVLLVIGTGTGLVIPALYFLFGKFLVFKKTTPVQNIEAAQGWAV